MSMSHVGIDISANNIRYLELIKTAEGLVLGRYGIQKIPTPISFNEPLISNKDLVAGLKKIQRANKFEFVEVSIPEDKSYLFTTEIPSGDEDVIRSHIEFHLEENVPIPLNEAVFDYHVIHRDDKKGVNFASVSVVPQQVIDQYIEVFEEAGMIPVSFLIENQALTKAIIPEDDDCMYLVADFQLRMKRGSFLPLQIPQYTDQSLVVAPLKLMQNLHLFYHHDESHDSQKPLHLKELAHFLLSEIRYGF
jgi:hypothetical protein